MTRRECGLFVSLLLGAVGCEAVPSEPDDGEPFLLSQISAYLTTCGTTNEGGGYCWSLPSAGAQALVPRQIPLPAGVIVARVSAGRGSCALTNANTAYCLDESTGATWAPLVLPGSAGIRSINGSALHICALSLAGAGFCWGDNELGRLGDGTTLDRSAPTPVMMPAGVTFAALEIGEYNGCGLTPGGKAWCWGYNGEGQMGDGTTSNLQTVPAAAAMPGLTFTTLAVGVAHVCGLTQAGAAYCWGFGHRGRLGNGTTDDKHVPTAVLMPPQVTFTTLTAGRDHTCGLTPEGMAWCWGRNFAGAVGDGTVEHRWQPTAVAMPSGVSFVGISAGFGHTCAVATGGQGWCWGYNQDGRLGDGTTEDRYSPVRMVQRSAGLLQ